MSQKDRTMTLTDGTELHPHGSTVEQVHRLLGPAYADLRSTDEGVWLLAEEIVKGVRTHVAREIRAEANRKRGDRPEPFDIETDVANQRACNTWDRVADWIESPHPVTATDA